MAGKTCKVILRPQNEELSAPHGTNLLKFLQSKNISIGNACGGMGLCASCKVVVLANEKNLSRAEDHELDLKDRNNLQNSERIACQCKILGDIEITTSYW